MALLILDATTKSIVVAMSGAAATTNPDFTAAWADNNGTIFTEGATDGALNGTSSVTLVTAPAASTRRTIKAITIENKDTAAVTLTISYNNNSTLRTIAKVTLQVGDTWTTDGTFDTNGSLKQTLGTVNLASVTGTLGTANGGTGVTTSTGSGSNVLSTSPTLVTPLLGTPTSGNLSNYTADGTHSVGYRNIPQSGSDKTSSYTLATTGHNQIVNGSHARRRSPRSAGKELLDDGVLCQRPCPGLDVLHGLAQRPNAARSRGRRRNGRLGDKPAYVFLRH